jgi:hypothetical protein
MDRSASDASRAAATPELLERELELGELDAGFALTTVGAGRLLLQEGHAGIGKSSLIAAAQVRAEDAGLRVLRARCSPLEQEFAWGTAVELLAPTLAASSASERTRLLGDEFNAVNLTRDDFHGEWNYAIQPNIPAQITE